jgi:hypothetical protein
VAAAHNVRQEMNDFFQVMFSRGSLIGAGSTLFFVGMLLWHFPRIYKKRITLRILYAESLRASGEEESAQKVEAETALLIHRLPVWGRMFVAVGAVVILASIFATG